MVKKVVNKGDKTTGDYVLNVYKEWGKGTRNLVVVDVSSVMRTYHHSPFSKDYSYMVNKKEVKTGAMFGLFNQFARFSLRDNVDYVFCFDSTNGLLNKISNNYKDGRVSIGHEYFDQVNTMYKLLEEIGFKVMLYSGSIKSSIGNFKNVGLEADHCIGESVRQNYDFYDNIAVLSGDNDLGYLVDDKVTLVRTIKSRGDVTKDNYHIKLKCPYNSIILKKITVGDKSDNIAGITRFGEKAFIKFMEEQVPKDLENVYGHEEEIILNSDLSEEKKGQALYELQKVAPITELEIYDKNKGKYVELDGLSNPTSEIDRGLMTLILEKYGMFSTLDKLEKLGLK